MRPRLGAAAVAAASLLVANGVPVGAAFVCSTVVRSGDMDPDDRPLTPAFVDRVAVNQAGDVLVIGRPIVSRPKLYLYPTVGPAETIAASNGPAPNGGLYAASQTFKGISINDAGDIAFLARLALGLAIFVRTGGTFETAAETAAPSPNGGFFEHFGAVSQINAAGQVAFSADVLGAPGGVFLYDSATDARSTVLEIGDLTSEGRSLCSIHAVAIGDAGGIAIEATTKVDCADVFEPVVPGIFLYDGGTIDPVATAGQASPIGATTYVDFEPGLFVTAAGAVGFRADVTGIARIGAIFLFDPGTATTSTLIARGDAVPSGGAVGKIAGFEVSDDGRAFMRSSLTGTTERFGVFADHDPVLVRSSTPPLDAFGVGAAFNNLGVPAASSAGAALAVHVRVRDVERPRSKRAILRCME
jgi:hypothetical protein